MIILHELSLPHEIEIIPYHHLKLAPFTSLNPNGRAPVLLDPNTGVKIWESGAITEYLLSTYDATQKLSHGDDDGPLKWEERQWLFFQVSGQGPYFGQAAWFNLHHHEPLPSARKRYMDEVNRIVRVIDTHLASRPTPEHVGHPVLVGEKCTYADLVFVMWHQSLEFIFAKFPWEWEMERYPMYREWMEGLMRRPAVGCFGEGGEGRVE